ncbi:proline dehydrogenase family protein [Neolewinella lacunae]|uniref:Proline dehydrogenase family protein n=1 Tax=Neolewinella lacunae TaxID=1517758 RepID=A0A923PG75_9BACT|nr:proline dehydrogenase family protein [Neolewinella lacunae]MBC6993495.1 proline dehydrogenase family protein [Neolewinella lacunae]MDN3636229.1 proline dehydrogenase family protein [Neolewinella lacunae]
MKDTSGPVRKFPLAEQAAKDLVAMEQALPLPDFSDTEKTFRHLSDAELKYSARLFQLMGLNWLTSIMSSLGVGAVKLGLPGAEWSVKNTIYRQFVGGTSLVTALPTIERLFERNVKSILDYGAEAKNSEEDYNVFMKEVLRAIEFSRETEASAAVVVKITGLSSDAMLEWLNEQEIDFDDDTHSQFQALLRRLDAICGQAEKFGIQVYIDAEESWMQNTIDQLANKMMARYNREKVIVLNTFQLYRHDRLQFLIDSHTRARQEGYLLGAKLVRGAYMVKEKARAEEKGYPSPIQPSLEATHHDYNTALRYCIDNINTIACCVGSHNEASIRLTTELLAAAQVPRSHPHIQFAQLLGMSDNLTFNLAAGGYNVAKYLVYGPVKEVLPYLTRRAQENASVTGEMGRELKLIHQELARRGKA